MERSNLPDVRQKAKNAQSMNDGKAISAMQRLIVDR